MIQRRNILFAPFIIGCAQDIEERAQPRPMRPKLDVFEQRQSLESIAQTIQRNTESSSEVLSVISDSARGTAVSIENLGTYSAWHVLEDQVGSLVFSQNGRARRESVKNVWRSGDLARLDHSGSGNTGTIFGQKTFKMGPCPNIGDYLILLGMVHPHRVRGTVVRTETNEQFGRTWIVQANISFGFSGGAALDLNGRIVGLIVAKYESKIGESVIVDLEPITGIKCNTNSAPLVRNITTL